MTTKVSNGWTRRNDDSERKYVGVVSGGNGRYRATSVTHNSFITSLGGLDTRTEDTFNFPSMTQQRARATESPSSAESSSKRKRERGHRGGGGQEARHELFGQLFSALSFSTMSRRASWLN